MQYIIMKQINFNTWTSSLGINDPVYVYNTLLEAQTKLEELKTNNPNKTVYMIESYPDGSDI